MTLWTAYIYCPLESMLCTLDRHTLGVLDSTRAGIALLCFERRGPCSIRCSSELSII
jgi:hypothetical protein